jgi:hypothetical protein
MIRTGSASPWKLEHPSYTPEPSGNVPLDCHVDNPLTPVFSVFFGLGHSEITAE